MIYLDWIVVNLEKLWNSASTHVLTIVQDLTYKSRKWQPSMKRIGDGWRCHSRRQHPRKFWCLGLCSHLAFRGRLNTNLMVLSETREFQGIDALFSVCSRNCVRRFRHLTDMVSHLTGMVRGVRIHKLGVPSAKRSRAAVMAFSISPQASHDSLYSFTVQGTRIKWDRMRSCLAAVSLKLTPSFLLIMLSANFCKHFRS